MALHILALFHKRLQHFAQLQHRPMRSSQNQHMDTFEQLISGTNAQVQLHEVANSTLALIGSQHFRRTVHKGKTKLAQLLVVLSLRSGQIDRERSVRKLFKDRGQNIQECRHLGFGGRVVFE